MKKIFTTRHSIWAVATILLAVLIVAIFFKHSHVHYEMLMKASRDFWSLHNPYGSSLHEGEGMITYWLYTPFCAIFFFPFTFLPFKLGLGLFLILSLGIFIYGLLQFLETLKISPDQNSLGIFYLIASSEVVGAIQADKLELSMIGILFLAYSYILKNDSKNWILSACLLSLISLWKLQPLACVGLLSFSFLLKKDFRKFLIFLGSFSISSILYLSVPFLFLNASFVRHTYFEWVMSLSSAVQQTWQVNPTAYTFFHNQLGFPLTATDVNVIGLSVACLLTTSLFLLRKKNTTQLVLASCALGSLYGAVFSPLSQSTSYVLGTPMLLCFFLITKDFKWGLAFLGLHWFLTSFAYSSASPDWLMSLATGVPLKPITFMGMGILYFILVRRAKSSGSIRVSSR